MVGKSVPLFGMGKLRHRAGGVGKRRGKMGDLGVPVPSLGMGMEKPRQGEEKG